MEGGTEEGSRREGLCVMGIEWRGGIGIGNESKYRKARNEGKKCHSQKKRTMMIQSKNVRDNG